MGPMKERPNVGLAGPVQSHDMRFTINNPSVCLPHPPYLRSLSLPLYEEQRCINHLPHPPYLPTLSLPDCGAALAAAGKRPASHERGADLAGIMNTGNGSEKYIFLQIQNSC